MKNPKYRVKDIVYLNDKDKVFTEEGILKGEILEVYPAENSKSLYELMFFDFKILIPECTIHGLCHRDECNTIITNISDIDEM